MYKRLPLLAAALVLAFAGHLPTVHAESGITGTTNLKATVNVPLAITDVQITGRTGTIPVKLFVTNGTLAFGSTTGLVFDGPSTGAEIYFSGDVEDVNAALTTLTYTRAGTGSDALEVSLVAPGEVFFDGHLYEYISVPGGITWTDAEAAAKLLTRYGSTGYLTTIMSVDENDFVADRLGGAGWMGASDAGDEGIWRWVTGPEGDAPDGGTHFFTDGEEPITITYANWNPGEPNNSGNENCGQFLSGVGQNGQWNDLRCTETTLPGYVVEFGTPDDLPDTDGNEFTITTYTAPSANSFTPADNATNIRRNDNLSITFDTNVEVGTGNITIRRTSNDAIVETIDVTSGRVTGSGTTTLTIDPSNTLPNGVELYVQIDATAVDAVAGGSYAGIANTTAWSFTTQRISESNAVPITSPSLEVVNAVASCDGGLATGTVRVAADGASEYLLSNNSLTGTWAPLTNGQAVVPWTFAIANGTARLYASARNSSWSVVYMEIDVAITATCDDETTNEETDASESPEDASDDAIEVRTGPSPWNGSIERITDTSGMQLIKGEHFDTVYWLQDGMRRPFTSEAIYFTYFTDFDDVHTVTDATLSTITLGIPVLPKRGTLIKIPSIPDVYEVTTGESLEHIPSETAATERFGTAWAKLVIDVDVTLLQKFVR